MFFFFFFSSTWHNCPCHSVVSRIYILPLISLPMRSFHSNVHGQPWPCWNPIENSPWFIQRRIPRDPASLKRIPWKTSFFQHHQDFLIVWIRLLFMGFYPGILRLISTASELVDAIPRSWPITGQAKREKWAKLRPATGLPVPWKYHSFLWKVSRSKPH